MKKEKVDHFFEKSLSSLQLDYVDLYLIHAPFGLDSKSDDDPIPMKNGEVVLDPETNLEAIWKAMESLVQNGKVKSIGISNFDETQIQRIVKVAKVPPTVLQVIYKFF
jgi:alcohol dehydrogenase (NADP+)